MTPFVSQVLGLSLAITTAAGCMAYERLVKVYPFWVIGLFVSLHYVPFWALSTQFQRGHNIPQLKDHWGSFAVLMVSGITSPIWYVITRKQGLLVSSLYEVKYIGVLALFYIIFGQQKVTVFSALALLFALMSIWCLSHSK